MPERLKVKHSKNARERWWLYERNRPELYSTIARLDRVLVVALVSRTVMPARVSSRQVLSHKLGVFALEGDAHLALLSSSIHSGWSWRNSSTMKADLNYSPSDVYETMPQPVPTERMARTGATLESHRCDVMLQRQIGLTKLYNLFHDPSVSDDDIVELRGIHREIDEATISAYEWHDLDLEHDFYSTRQGFRFGIGTIARIEVLDRLLELNHTDANNISAPQSKITDKAPQGQRGSLGNSPDVLFD